MILTICIPTFNRAEYLERCINSIFSQLTNNRPSIEVKIFDNCSTDDTKIVVNRLIKKFDGLKYFCHTSNIGPDLNIGNCYLQAESRYVWVLGDDDVLLPGCLDYVLNILKNGEFGVVYLNFYDFKCDYSKEKPFFNPQKSYEYAGGKILSRVVSNVSFISSNIVNTKFISKVEIEATTGTGLNQMPGILNAIISSPRNIFVNKYFLAQQKGNSGGFKYFTVFGKNFPEILEKYLKERKYRYLILNQLLINVLPLPLLRSKKNLGNIYEENPFDIMQPYFKQSNFWKFIYPIKKLPYFLALGYTFFIWLFGKVCTLIRKIPNSKVYKI